MNGHGLIFPHLVPRHKSTRKRPVRNFLSFLTNEKGVRYACLMTLSPKLQCMQLAIWAIGRHKEALVAFVEGGGSLDMTYWSAELDEDGQQTGVIDILLAEDDLESIVFLVEAGADPGPVWAGLSVHGYFGEARTEGFARSLIDLIATGASGERQHQLNHALAALLQDCNLGLIGHILDAGANPLDVFHPDGKSTALDLARLVDDRHPLGPEVVRLLEAHAERQRLGNILAEATPSVTDKPSLRL